MERLYDVKQAAEMLAVSPWTIRAYVRTGKLRPIRMGRLVRLQAEELEKFVALAKVQVEEVDAVVKHEKENEIG